ncbi:N-acetyltransferase [Erythrobacter sp. HKB08]|uniref:GNAT family N-acetyltransferase n=1 Tax=Erythrobacter sp. HKB08 TaxID=2502843 RepID=UPI0013E8A010|nr:GNAT family N-acetyltransferase [Erythrobacter sp. HKB08]
MSETGIIAVDESRSREVLDVITLAFARDPVARFWWTAADQYLHWWPRWVVAIGRNGFKSGGVDAFSDFGAAAIWLPPGIETDPADIAALDMPSGEPEIDALGEALQGEMAKFHPHEDHWYLWTLGADPARQGEGLGGRLLEHRLAVTDDAGMPAYLEASSPGLVPFYKRYGFEPVGLIEVSPVPPLVPMYRKPR